MLHKDTGATSHSRSTMREHIDGFYYMSFEVRDVCNYCCDGKLILKYATFVPTPKECLVEDTTKLFFKHMVKY